MAEMFQTSKSKLRLATALNANFPPMHHLQILSCQKKGGYIHDETRTISD